jgi:hypothetical protein
MRTLRKTIGWILVGACLLVFTVDIAIKSGWHAVWIVPVCLGLWSGLGVLVGLLFRD